MQGKFSYYDGIPYQHDGNEDIISNDLEIHKHLSSANRSKILNEEIVIKSAWILFLC